MGRIIGASIDLSKIDKSRIKEGKNGTGKYYDITIMVNDTPDDYGKDVKILQGQSKEEREAKATKIYIGNGKTVYNKDAPAGDSTASSNHTEDDGLPF